MCLQWKCVILNKVKYLSIQSFTVDDISKFSLTCCMTFVQFRTSAVRTLQDFILLEHIQDALNRIAAKRLTLCKSSLSKGHPEVLIPKRNQFRRELGAALLLYCIFSIFCKSLITRIAVITRESEKSFLTACFKVRKILKPQVIQFVNRSL